MCTKPNCSAFKESVTKEIDNNEPQIFCQWHDGNDVFALIIRLGEGRQFKDFSREKELFVYLPTPNLDLDLDFKVSRTREIAIIIHAYIYRPFSPFRIMLVASDSVLQQ